MNKNDVTVGGRYEAKAGKRWVGVTILGPAKAGWNAVSDMGKPVKVKDARNLRPAQEEAAAASEAAPELEPASKRASRAKARPAKATPTTTTPARMSCLDAAAAVLKANGAPMQTKAMIDAMHTQGLWSSDAPTPAATLYSAILREMKVKGDANRFRKTSRGHFDLTGGKE